MLAARGKKPRGKKGGKKDLDTINEEKIDDDESSQRDGMSYDDESSKMSKTKDMVPGSKKGNKNKPVIMNNIKNANGNKKATQPARNAKKNKMVIDDESQDDYVEDESEY